MKSYILGGGITGLVAGFYTGWPVIARRVGGQLSRGFPLGPKYIYANSFNQELLEQLGIDTSTTVVKVGYFYRGRFVKPSKQLQEAYSKKTRGTVISGAMSGMLEEFAAFTVDPTIVVECLADECDIIQDQIISIDLEERVMYGLHDIYEYDLLVSTIPLPEFMELTGIRCSKLAWRSILFVAAECSSDLIWDNDYDYICFPGDEPFYRITKLAPPNVVYEFSVNPGYKVSIDYLPDTIPTDYYLLRYGKIVDKIPIINGARYGVKLLGRYGSWNPRMMLHHVIREVKSWID